MKTLAVGERDAAGRAGVNSRRRERLFYTGMAAAFVLTVFAGFARTYYLRPYFGAASLSPLLHLHGVVFTSWLVRTARPSGAAWHSLSRTRSGWSSGTRKSGSRSLSGSHSGSSRTHR